MKSSGWKNLKPYPLDRKWKEQLPLGPKDRHRHGTLPNGMRYYVQKTHKPKDRAALALAVDVGSIAETEEERGVAHLVEHLAFRATESNDNFAIVKFLESIGAEFGACQNAYTSMDETVYELLVPIDKPNVLEQALDVYAEFATKIRISDADVNDERGAVMEELRMGRDARGRRDRGGAGDEPDERDDVQELFGLGGGRDERRLGRGLGLERDAGFRV